MVSIDALVDSSGNDTYFGFDFGKKKIGLAVGQLTTKTASPLQTVRSINQKPDWKIFSKLITEWQPVGLVVGVSRRSDGSDNPVTPRILKFCRQLEGRYQLPVHQIDESFSTFAAKQMLFDEAKVSAAKLWEVQDQMAAQLILQSWLNEQA